MFGANTIGIFFAMPASAVYLRVGKPRGADDGAGPVAGAGFEMGQRSLGSREIDKHVGRLRRSIDIGADDNAGVPAAALARVVSGEGTAGHVERRRQNQSRIGEHRLDERLTHAAARAGDRNSRRHAHHPNVSLMLSHQERESPHFISPAVRAAASRFSSAADGGTSSPSQRASLSSTK